MDDFGCGYLVVSIMVLLSPALLIIRTDFIASLNRMKRDDWERKEDPKYVSSFLVFPDFRVM
jgi:hypothetical protein